MRINALVIASLATTVTVSAGAYAKPLLIVSAEATGEVVFVNPVKAEVVDRIKVGARPRGLKLTRDGRRLLVALAGPAKPAARPGAAPAPQPAGGGSAGLAVIDVATRKVGKQITTPASPFGVDLSPDGRTAYLSDSQTNEVFVIDLGAGSVKKKTSVGAEPRGVTVRPDGKVVYVATHGADEVSAIDPKTMTLLGRIDAGARPQAIVMAPRGELAFVLDEGAPIVTTLDTKRNMFKEQFVIAGLAKATPPPALQAAVLSRDGKRLYLTTGPGRSVLIVDLAKKAAVGSVEGVGGFPRGIAMSADGKKLYTANGASNDVAIIDIASKKVEARIAVPGAPWDIVVAP